MKTRQLPLHLRQRTQIPVTFGVWYLPAGAQLTANTFIWTPDDNQSGYYTATFFATDGVNTVFQDVPVLVNNVVKPGTND